MKSIQYVVNYRPDASNYIHLTGLQTAVVVDVKSTLSGSNNLPELESDQSLTQLKSHIHFQLSDFCLTEPVNT